MAREVNIPAAIVLEDIRMLQEVTDGYISVMVGRISSTGEFIVPQQYETYEIKDDDFAELMSANPPWAPGKPAGTYRNEDLWIFIDRKRASNA
jgi:hypothetical protein